MASARLLFLLCIIVCLSQLLPSDAVRLESGTSLDKAASPVNSSFCDSSCKDPKSNSFTSVLCMFCGLANHNGSEPLESVAELPRDARNPYSPEECKHKCQPGSTAYISEACSSCEINVLPVLPADDSETDFPGSIVVSLPNDYSQLCNYFCSSSSRKSTYFCTKCLKAKSPAPAPVAPPTMSEDPKD